MKVLIVMDRMLQECAVMFPSILTVNITYYNTEDISISPNLFAFSTGSK